MFTYVTGDCEITQFVCAFFDPPPVLIQYRIADRMIVVCEHTIRCCAPSKKLLDNLFVTIW